MSGCVVLVPVYGTPVPECEDALRALERGGYEVWRVRGHSAIDAARNQMATDALARGFDELMWVDADVAFDPADVDRLRALGLPVACGLYPKKGVRQMAAAFLPETRTLRFGARGGPTEILYCGFGFTLVRRAVFDGIRETLGLAACNSGFGGAGLVPYFQPLVVPHGPDATWYLAEDMAFCHRARAAGFAVVADTLIRLWHVGAHKYGWEDAGADTPRYADYTYHLGPGAEAVPPPAPPAEPPRGPLRGPAETLPRGFPRLGAYLVTYPANLASAKLTLDDFRQSDWGQEPGVFVQPAEWPAGKESASRNYKRALERAAADGVDFAVILEDDVRVCRHLRHNLTTLPLVRRDQCDYLSLFMPDLVAAPWERSEPHLGYRLARPAYAGPNRTWEKFRSWGSQAYVLSRRFVLAALERWDELREGQDARVISVCAAHGLPMWYAAPCLVEHAPLASAFGTPAAYAPDFDPAFRLAVGPGFQPPEAVPG